MLITLLLRRFQSCRPRPSYGITWIATALPVHPTPPITESVSCSIPGGSHSFICGDRPLPFFSTHPHSRGGAAQYFLHHSSPISDIMLPRRQICPIKTAASFWERLPAWLRSPFFRDTCWEGRARWLPATRSAWPTSE